MSRPRWDGLKDEKPFNDSRVAGNDQRWLIASMIVLHEDINTDVHSNVTQCSRCHCKQTSCNF